MKREKVLRFFVLAAYMKNFSPIIFSKPAECHQPKFLRGEYLHFFIDSFDEHMMDHPIRGAIIFCGRS